MHPIPASTNLRGALARMSSCSHKRRSHHFDFPHRRRLVEVSNANKNAEKELLSPVRYFPRPSAAGFENPRALAKVGAIRKAEN